MRAGAVRATAISGSRTALSAANTIKVVTHDGCTWFNPLSRPSRYSVAWDGVDGFGKSEASSAPSRPAMRGVSRSSRNVGPEMRWTRWHCARLTGRRASYAREGPKRAKTSNARPAFIEPLAGGATNLRRGQVEAFADGQVVWSWRREAGAKPCRERVKSNRTPKRERFARRQWQESPFTGESTK
jgi:hypothetical protein